MILLSILTGFYAIYNSTAGLVRTETNTVREYSHVSTVRFDSYYAVKVTTLSYYNTASKPNEVGVSREWWKRGIGFRKERSVLDSDRPGFLGTPTDEKARAKFKIPDFWKEKHEWCGTIGLKEGAYDYVLSETDHGDFPYVSKICAFQSPGDLFHIDPEPDEVNITYPRTQGWFVTPFWLEYLLSWNLFPWEVWEASLGRNRAEHIEWIPDEKTIPKKYVQSTMGWDPKLKKMVEKPPYPIKYIPDLIVEQKHDEKGRLTYELRRAMRPWDGKEFFKSEMRVKYDIDIPPGILEEPKSEKWPDTLTEAETKRKVLYREVDDPSLGNPENSFVYLTRGKIDLHKKEYEKAISNFEKYLSFKPWGVAGMFGLAKAYSALGNIDKGREYYRKVITDRRKTISEEVKKDMQNQSMALLEDTYGKEGVMLWPEQDPLQGNGAATQIILRLKSPVAVKSLPLKVKSLVTGEEIVIHLKRSNPRLFAGTLTVQVNYSDPAKGIMKVASGDKLQADFAGTKTLPPASVTFQVHPEIRVNCGGGDFVDEKGFPWSGDRPYEKGSWGYVAGSDASTGNKVEGANGLQLYQTERWGGIDMNYTFDVPTGTYKVDLHFADTWFGEGGGGGGGIGNRVFDVKIGDALVLDDFDILKEAGMNKAIVKSFDTVVTDGHLTITFPQTKSDKASIRGIEVVPVADPI